MTGNPMEYLDGFIVHDIKQTLASHIKTKAARAQGNGNKPGDEEAEKFLDLMSMAMVAGAVYK